MAKSHVFFGCFVAPWVSVYLSIIVPRRLHSNQYSYLILPMAFGNADDFRIDKTATAVVSLLFVGASYASSIVIAFFQRDRKLFLLRSLFMSVSFYNPKEPR